MFLQKQKYILKKFLPWYVLRPLAMMVVTVTVVGLSAYAQPLPKHPSASPRPATHISTATKVPAKPPTPVPAAAPTPAPAPAPAPVKKAVATAGSRTQPVVTPSPGSSVSGLTPTSPSPSPSQPSGGSQTTTGYTSLNWSGYLAANATFTAVSGSWNATMATGNGSTTTADSTWIGIGGVTSNDLIQVGTENIISANGQVSTAAFYEMLPASSQTIPSLKVSEGDSMSASVVEIGSGLWTISITDNTTGKSWSATVSYASSLSSAEWIEEDPSYANGQLIPFANFGGAVFTAGRTTMNGSSLTIAGSTSQPVTMVNSGGQPIAVPSAIGGDGASFSVAP